MDLKPNSWLGKKLLRADIGGRTMPPSPSQLAETYGVNLVGKVSGLNSAGIFCSDGETVPLESLNVIWCTGFQSRYDFIQPLNRHDSFDMAGQPIHERGQVPAAPGLYFVGMRYQYTATSQDLYGVGRDAQYVAQHIAATRMN